MVKKLGLKLKEQKGFTLIELLAVIVILGIIAAIAIPAITNVIDKSDKKAQVQEGLLIINAAKMYVANNNVTADTDLSLDGTLGTETNKGALDDYLDRVEGSGFVVNVDATSSPGTFKYSISLHKSAELADPSDDIATEDQLLNYKN